MQRSSASARLTRLVELLNRFCRRVRGRQELGASEQSGRRPYLSSVRCLGSYQEPVVFLFSVRSTALLPAAFPRGVFFALACSATAEPRVRPGLENPSLCCVQKNGRCIDSRRSGGLSSGFEVLRLVNPEPSTRRALAVSPVLVAASGTFPCHLSSPGLRSFVGAPLPSLLLPVFWRIFTQDSHWHIGCRRASRDRAGCHQLRNSRFQEIGSPIMNLPKHAVSFSVSLSFASRPHLVRAVYIDCSTLRRNRRSGATAHQQIISCECSAYPSPCHRQSWSSQRKILKRFNTKPLAFVALSPSPPLHNTRSSSVSLATWPRHLWMSFSPIFDNESPFLPREKND